MLPRRIDRRETSTSFWLSVNVNVGPALSGAHAPSKMFDPTAPMADAVSHVPSRLCCAPSWQQPPVRARSVLLLTARQT